MDEYIRLDKTIIGIDTLINEASTAEEAKVLFTVKDVIYSQQRYSADEQPVKHGAWISYNWHEGIFDGWGIQCDQCLERYKNGLRKKNFCPNCGARMDGDTNG